MICLVACAPASGHTSALSIDQGTFFPAGEDLRNVSDEALVEDLAHRTFNFFWETANPENGLVPDRWPTPSFSSIAAVGFALAAYPIGVERGYVSRESARERVLATLRFFKNAPQGEAASGMAGYKGFFYHFLGMKTGARFSADVELSTIDTTLLLGGVLFCASYFDGDDPQEEEIRSLAEALYAQVDWEWALAERRTVSMGWKPESGFIKADWVGYDEAMLLYILAIGSPTHPLPPAAWDEWAKGYADNWGDADGEPRIMFPPLFGHQYSHAFVDFRGIADRFMREKGFDYFENSRRAVYAQRNYAIRNPHRWRGYDENVWGLTASDGPIDAKLDYRGEKRDFHTYAARGHEGKPDHGQFMKGYDDGTIAPTAAAASIAFAPEIAIPAIRAMRTRYGREIYGDYGFFDAFNPSFDFEVAPKLGRRAEGVGWRDTDYLGIDQGPILIMIENHQNGLVWKVMRRNPHIREGLKRAGFSGGWLDE
ncbi:MAG: glucoamylase family protein [Pseudomonadota bacterium]